MRLGDLLPRVIMGSNSLEGNVGPRERETWQWAMGALGDYAACRGRRKGKIVNRATEKHRTF